jgi:hypothetical protein
MKNQTFTAISILAIVIACSTSSCKKEARENAKLSASDYAIAESIFNDLHQQSDNSFDRSSSPLTGDCPTITFQRENNTNPDTMIVDFGEACTDNRGIKRSGKIIAIYTGPYKQKGTVITITTENFYRNDNKVEGTKTVTNQGANAEGHIVYDIEVKNAKVITSEGEISWSSNRTRKWVKGFDTPWPNWLDDVYEITGTASGTNTKGSKFEIEITSPLRVELNCRWIVSGVLELKPEDLPTRKLDYGDGKCDNKAMLSVKNRDFEILLR